MKSIREINNYFHVRWVDGYNYVSDARNDLNLLIESWLFKMKPYEEGSHVEYFFDKENNISFGILIKKVFVDSIERNCNYYHVIAVHDPTIGPLSQKIFQELFSLVYGDKIDEEIERNYDKIAKVKKREGRSILNKYHIDIKLLKQIVEKHGKKDDARQTGPISQSAKKTETGMILQDHIEDDSRKAPVKIRPKYLEEVQTTNNLKTVGSGKILKRVVFVAFLGLLVFVFSLFYSNLSRKYSNLSSKYELSRKKYDVLMTKYNDLEIKFQEEKKEREQLLENHKIIKKIGKFEYESIRGTKKASDGTMVVALEIDILSEIYRWQCGNYERIVRGDKEYDPADIISDYKKNENLKDSKGLICVGMASQEGTRGNEEKRAEMRMETLMYSAWKSNVDGPIYGLNLGQYVGEGEDGCSDSTLWQRRVVLLKIIKKRPNLPDEELKNGIISILVDKAKNKHIVFPIDIIDYSKYRYGKLTLTHGSN